MNSYEEFLIAKQKNFFFKMLLSTFAFDVCARYATGDLIPRFNVDGSPVTGVLPMVDLRDTLVRRGGSKGGEREKGGRCTHIVDPHDSTVDPLCEPMNTKLTLKTEV